MERSKKPSIILSEMQTTNQALCRINSLTQLQLRNNNYSDIEVLECIADIAKYTLSVRCAS